MRKPTCGQCSKSGKECKYLDILRACTPCSLSWVKCDHGKPKCGMCIKSGKECTYPERAAKRSLEDRVEKNPRIRPSGRVPHYATGIIEEVVSGFRRAKYIYLDSDHPENLGYWNLGERRVQVTHVRPGDMHPTYGVVPEQAVVVDEHGVLGLSY